MCSDRTRRRACGRGTTRADPARATSGARSAAGSSNVIPRRGRSVIDLGTRTSSRTRTVPSASRVYTVRWYIGASGSVPVYEARTVIVSPFTVTFPSVRVSASRPQARQRPSGLRSCIGASLSPSLSVGARQQDSAGADSSSARPSSVMPRSRQLPCRSRRRCDRRPARGALCGVLRSATRSGASRPRTPSVPTRDRVRSRSRR